MNKSFEKSLPRRHDHKATSDQEDSKDYWSWKWLLELDKQTPRILLRSPQVVYRAALVNKLRRLCGKNKLCMEVLYKAVALLDHYMDTHSIPPDILDIFTLACLSIAGKIYGSRVQARKLTMSFRNNFQKAYRKVEFMLCKHMEWRLLFPTPASFAIVLCQHHAFRERAENPAESSEYLPHNSETLLNKYLDLTLSDFELNAVNRAELACACVSCARTELGLSAWPPHLVHTTGYTHETIAPLAERLHSMMELHNELEHDEGYISRKNSPDHSADASSSGSSSSNDEKLNNKRSIDSPLEDGPSKQRKDCMSPVKSE